MAKKADTAASGSAETPLSAWVARARGVGGLVGFAIAFWVCRGQGFPLADAVIRGLAGAVAMSLVAWWSSLLVIQALMRSAAAQANREALEAAAAEAAAAQADEPAFTRRGASGGEAS